MTEANQAEHSIESLKIYIEWLRNIMHPTPTFNSDVMLQHVATIEQYVDKLEKQTRKANKQK